MGSSTGYGFREVLIDQPFTGKWMEVDMNLGGGHSTFQGTKFSDFAGGFSFKNASNGKPIIQNRCIYWRTLNDTLELTEISMDFNLVDNQVRYIFQDSPIVGPITIQETESSVVILVATVTSVNRFIFTHPKRVNEMSLEKAFIGNNKPSIFHQICNKPQMNFRSFNLYEHALNIPVPLSATCYYIERGAYFNQGFHANNSVINGECLFAFSFETGSIHVYKICREETLLMYDLRQANLFTRLFSGFAPSLMRGSGSSSDAVIGLSFFTSKAVRERESTVQLVTLSMNGQVSLWLCCNLDIFTEWTSYHSGVVDNQFALDGHTDSSMLLRKSVDHGLNELPFFAVYIPGDGFKVYRVQKNSGPNSVGDNSSPPTKFILQTTQEIDFKDRELMDFSITPEYLFTLVNNPEEETEWAIKSYKLDDDLNPRFNLTLLEPLPLPDVSMLSGEAEEAKEFYMDLIFNKCSFSSQTITKALTMFRKEEDDVIKDKDWESLRITAMNVIDREIGLATSNSEYDIADDEYTELSLRFWLMFYNSCVEYHIHTVKPLGLFYESNTKMVCVVKKSRISFLRPTDFLETIYYFPMCLELPDVVDVGEDRHCELQLIVKYLEVIECLESIIDNTHKMKIEKRLRESVNCVQTACTDVSNILLSASSHCDVLEQKHLIPILGSKMRDLGMHSENNAMRMTINLISTWEGESETLNPMEDVDMGSGPQVSDCFMGSRIGSHLTFRILKQLMEHRFMIARDTMLLQSLLVGFFSQNNSEDGVDMLTPCREYNDALSATLGYYALLNLAESTIDFVRPFIKERGLKVANILKLHTADHLAADDFTDVLWPTKIVEGFCLSHMGRLFIRSSVNRTKSSSVLAHAETAARCIWTNNVAVTNHPFEDFLIVSCQYSILLKYANYMMHYFGNAKQPMKNFYLGLANLCLDDPDTALSLFRSISLGEGLEDQYFCMKVLEVPFNYESNITVSLYNSYYVKVIKIFQIFEWIPAVQMFAEDGLRVAENDDEATKMCSLAFKCALGLEDYVSAYRNVLQIPSQGHDRKEKLASLRMFVTKILQKGEIDILINLDFGDMFNTTTSVREQVEQILFAQANLSDPLKEDGVYQMLYAYYLSRDNFQKAAGTMYYRAMRLGEKGRGLMGLKYQRDCYFDVITCLSLIEPNNSVFVTEKKGRILEVYQAESCFEGSQVFGDDISMIVRKYSDVQRELELCCMMVKLNDAKPIKFHEFPRRAEQAVDILTLNHQYDDAIKLATLWGISCTPVVSTFADVCCNLVYNILPESGNPGDYIDRNDVSELPSTETSYTEIAFRLLQSYLIKLEKSGESDLHKQVTLRFLAADIELPQWLVAAYKQRNTAQLLRCYIRYGKWDKATYLSLKLLDATLGRVRCTEFDPTIQKISSYDPVETVIPYKDINVLASQIETRIADNSSLKDFYNLLTERTNLFCDRIISCTQERNQMFTEGLEVDYKQN